MNNTLIGNIATIRGPYMMDLHGEGVDEWTGLRCRILRFTRDGDVYIGLERDGYHDEGMIINVQRLRVDAAV